MNFSLMENDYLPIIIPTEKRAIYYEALDNYAVSGELDAFIEIVYEQEEKELVKYEKLLGISSPNIQMQRQPEPAAFYIFCSRCSPALLPGSFCHRFLTIPSSSGRAYFLDFLALWNDNIIVE